MSWINKLVQTYEQANNADLNAASRPTPISHTTGNAHINITISGDGEFLSARVLQKTQIVFPATEKSAGRGSGEAPHPLADKLQYVAGDYKSYGGTKPAYFDSYLSQLSQWCGSDHTHLSAQAVLSYIGKKSVVSDLIQHKIVLVDKDGRLLTTWDKEVEEPPLFKVLPKEKKKLDQGNALVCWTVESQAIEDKDTWLNKELQRNWISYLQSLSNTQALCYVTGELQTTALSHPAKLRHTGDKAKIVSSNDWAGFTFRGRFTDSKKSSQQAGLQAVGIGSEATQKAHSALRWLIKTRKVLRNGNQFIVAWSISGKEIPDPFVATDKLTLDDFSESEPPNLAELEEFNPDHSRDIGRNYSKKLFRCLAGYRTDLETNDTISIMAIDSATQGRMGITYYREFMPKEYLDKISMWHSHFAWFQRTSREYRQKNGSMKKRVFWCTSPPTPYVILNRVYGDLLKSNDGLKKNFYERIIPCILEGTNIPYDLVLSAVNRASNPLGKEIWDWESCLGVACSLYRGFHSRHPQLSKRKEFSMTLEKENNSRDYLYGRLLAIAERIEEVALYASGVTRPTNANRMMQRFHDRPFSTWPTIYHQLDPYIRQLKTRRAGFLAKMMQEIDEVMSLFSSEEFKLDSRLSGEYLLGFHAQRLHLRPTSKNVASNDEKLEPIEEKSHEPAI